LRCYINVCTSGRSVRNVTRVPQPIVTMHIVVVHLSHVGFLPVSSDQTIKRPIAAHHLRQSRPGISELPRCQPPERGSGLSRRRIDECAICAIIRGRFPWELQTAVIRNSSAISSRLHPSVHMPACLLVMPSNDKVRATGIRE
jgi:hypothetical protein